MNEKAVLGTIRKYALWAVLCSAALLLVLEILKAWNVIDTVSGGGVQDVGNLLTNALMGGEMDFGSLSFAPPEPNVWGHIEETLAIILGLGSVVLVALLVSSSTKLGKADAKDAPAPAKPAAPAAKVAPTAKAAPAKAAAKPKK